MCLPDFRVAHLTCLLTRSNKKNSSDLCDRREKSERKVCWQKLTSDPWRKTWADDPGMETTVGHVGMKHFRGERRYSPPVISTSYPNMSVDVQGNIICSLCSESRFG